MMAYEWKGILVGILVGNDERDSFREDLFELMQSKQKQKNKLHNNIVKTTLKGLRNRKNAMTSHDARGYIMKHVTYSS